MYKVENLQKTEHKEKNLNNSIIYRHPFTLFFFKKYNV